MTGEPRLRVLVVEDAMSVSAPVAPLVQAAEQVRDTTVTASSLDAIRLIQAEEFDLVITDVATPHLNGLELGLLVTKLDSSIAVVIVADGGDHGAAAYQLGAVDYLHRPVDAARLEQTLRRVVLLALGKQLLAERRPAQAAPQLSALPVDIDGVVHYLRPVDVEFIEARGNRIRLHTLSGKHELRMPLSTVADLWQGNGFLRVHRSYLVSLTAVRELRIDSVGRSELVARTRAGDVPVSRAHARALRVALRDLGSA